MEIISYTHVRNKFANFMDKVCDDHDPVIVTRQKHAPIMMISIDDFIKMSPNDYNSLKETLYLLKSPKNAQVLNKAIAEVESGNVLKRDLIAEE